MDRKPCVSSNIAGYGYDAGSNTLEIEFTTGSVYAYSDVPQTIFDGLEAAESKGRYFNQAIKNQFTFERVK